MLQKLTLQCFLIHLSDMIFIILFLFTCLRVVIDNEDMQMMACPCQRMMCWAENWMILPYCRRGNGRENTAQPLHKVL